MKYVIQLRDLNDKVQGYLCNDRKTQFVTQDASKALTFSRNRAHDRADEGAWVMVFQDEDGAWMVEYVDWEGQPWTQPMNADNVSRALDKLVLRLPTLHMDAPEIERV